MSGTVRWQHRMHPCSHIVVQHDGAGTRFVLVGEQNGQTYASTQVFITLRAYDQVYLCSDVLALPQGAADFRLTVPVRIAEGVDVYSPKPDIIVCGLTAEIASDFAAAWNANSLIVHGMWGTKEKGYVVWAINNSVARALRDIVEKATETRATVPYRVALHFALGEDGPGTIQRAPDTLPETAYALLFRQWA